LDDLPKKFLTHEIHLEEDEEEVLTKKGMTFKMTSEDFCFSKDKSSNEESMTMIVCGLKKMFNSKRLNSKKIFKGSKRNGRFSKGKKKTF